MGCCFWWRSEPSLPVCKRFYPLPSRLTRLTIQTFVVGSKNSPWVGPITRARTLIYLRLTFHF